MVLIFYLFIDRLWDWESLSALNVLLCLCLVADEHGHLKIYLPKKLLECLPKCTSLPKERHRWNTNEVMSYHSHFKQRQCVNTSTFPLCLTHTGVLDMQEHIKPAFVSFSNYMHTAGSHVTQCGLGFNPEIENWLHVFWELHYLYRVLCLPILVFYFILFFLDVFV